MIRLASSAQRALLSAVTGLIDAGPGPGALSLYDGERPKGTEDGVNGANVLATVRFAKPAFGKPFGGSISAELPTGERALNSGKCTWARITDSKGNVVLDCDVGDEQSEAALKLNTTEIRKDGPVVVKSFAFEV